MSRKRGAIVIGLLWAAVVLRVLPAEAVCRQGPEGVPICDSPAEQSDADNKYAVQAQANKKSAEEAAQEREGALKFYCLSDKADMSVCQETVTAVCNGSTDGSCQEARRKMASGGISCPPGQVWNGAPAKDAMCVDESKGEASNPTTATSKPATAGSGPSNGKPANQDEQVSESVKSLAEECRSAAARAASTCESSVSQVQSMKSQIDQSGAQMQNQSPASACGQMATQANNVANQMQNSRNSCEQAVQQCSNPCDSAMSSLQSTKQSAAFLQASDGQSQCRNASSRLNSIDLTMNQIRTTSQQANKCYADATGSPLNLPSTGTSSPPSSGASAATRSDCASTGLNCGAGGGFTPVVAKSSGGPGTRSTSALGQNELLLGEGKDTTLPADYKKSNIGLQQAPGARGGAGPVAASTTAGGSANSSGKRTVSGEEKWRTGVLNGTYGEAMSGQRSLGSLATTTLTTSLTKNPLGVGGRPAGSPPSLDLRRFLPSGALRGPSGAGLQREIGGAHTSLFSTIRARYYREYDRLLP